MHGADLRYSLRVGRVLVVGGQWLHPATVGRVRCQLAQQRPPSLGLKVALVSQLLLAPSFKEAEFIDGKSIPEPL